MKAQLTRMVLNYELGLLSKYLNSISEYIDTLPDNVELTYKQLFDKIKSTKNEANEEAIEHYAGSMNDELIEACRDIPKLFYSSFLISCYSFIEQQMFKICETSDLKMSVGINECKSFGKGVERVKLFLRKSISYEFPNNEWNELLKFNKLRNYLVHSGNTINPAINVEINSPNVVTTKFGEMEIPLDIDPDLYNYVKTHKMIDSYGYHELIVPNKEYCEKIIALAKSLLNPLLDNIKV